MIKIFPLVSVIIPCFNSSSRLPKCLDSIKNQNYPKNKLEIIVVDDNSTDNTVFLAKEGYGCKVLKNGTHNIERGKSIGVEGSKGEYILLIDDDDIIPHPNWLKTLVESVITSGAVGGGAAYYAYDKSDCIANRYASLFAVGDPTCFYLNRRDKLMPIEKEWSLPGDIIEENKNYYKIRFRTSNLPTIGSQGFLIKREYLMKTTWKPYLYHMDTNLELVEMGYDTYIMMKDTIIHEYTNSINSSLNKLRRNISLFYSENEHRKYKYNLDKKTMVLLGLKMGTFIIPIKDSIKGFIKIHDLAWFIHPYFCFRVTILYTVKTLKNKV